jgi:hypothetical protein
VASFGNFHVFEELHAHPNTSATTTSAAFQPDFFCDIFLTSVLAPSLSLIKPHHFGLIYLDLP